MHCSSKRRNKRLFGWTMQEIEYLDEGVRKYGENWNDILESFSFHPSRNPNSLRKKYKRLEKERCKKGRGKNKGIHIRAWSEEEIEYLELGVDRYGTNWKKILDSFPFNNRTVNALSKKWRYEFRRGHGEEDLQRSEPRGRKARNNTIYDSPTRRIKKRRRRRRRRKKAEGGDISSSTSGEYQTVKIVIGEEFDEDKFDDEDCSSSTSSNSSSSSMDSMKMNQNCQGKERMMDEDDENDDIINLTYIEKPCDVMMTTPFSMPNGCLSPFRPQRAYSPKLHHYYGLEDYDFMNL